LQAANLTAIICRLYTSGGSLGAGKLKSQETIFSIVAADPEEGLFGIAAVASAPAIGKTVPFTGAVAGAIAVQGYTSPYFGVVGMKMLREGMPAGEMLESVLTDDPIRESRQILAIDSAGHTAAFTGGALPQYAGSVEGEGYVAGGCGLGSERLPPRCAEAFEKCLGGLAEKLLAALEEAATEEANREPVIAAVLRISKDTPHPWIDLRVDRRAEPVEEVRKLLARWRQENADAGERAEKGAENS